jgi:hypothetical protein
VLKHAKAAHHISLIVSKPLVLNNQSLGYHTIISWQEPGYNCSHTQVTASIN